MRPWQSTSVNKGLSVLTSLCRVAHELRNEIVEELIPNLMSESCTERTAPCVGGNRTRGMESKKGRRREELRKSQEKRPEGFHSEKQACPRRGNAEATESEGQTVAKPSEVAKRSGTPNNRIVTRPAVRGRTLRASRSAHVSR